MEGHHISHAAMARKHESDLKSTNIEMENKIPTQDKIKYVIQEGTSATTQAPTTPANT